MTVALALLGILVPASVALVGYWLKKQSETRLAQEQELADARLRQEREQSEKRLAQQHVEEVARLRLDAAMRAASLFEPSGGRDPSAAASASGLLALTQLDHADLAVALLVDLWSVDARTSRNDVPRAPAAAAHGPIEASHDVDVAYVSTETAILVINAALQAENAPNAQLIAAELLCRNARRLDPCQSLHWPAALDGRWVPSLATKAKLLVMDGLIGMTSNSPANENALRSLAVRLYGAWRGDPDNQRVRGCVGTLITSILPALRLLQYTDFMQAQEVVTLDQLDEASKSASPNPDGFLERLVNDRTDMLRSWSLQCTTCDFSPGSLASAAH